jgi:hypothetical protein
MSNELVNASANDNQPVAVFWCYRTLHAEVANRDRLVDSLDVEGWPRCRCCNRAMSLVLRDALP